MRSIIITLSLLIGFIIVIQAQSPGPTFNLDFEENTDVSTIPNNWIQWGDYKTSTETEIVQSGKYAGLIESVGTDGKFGSIAYRIPSNYTGKEITLEGYMKLENVQNGFAGLLLRLDGKSEPIGFDNMQNKVINGSRDWTQYSVSLSFSDKVERIVVGGVLVGTGKVWFDNFTVKIDGKSIQGMPLAEKPKPNAERDTEFDKGSTIELDDIEEEVAGRLFLLCKVWGFLKYHHPEIAKGNHNWDYELFRIMQHIREEDFKDELHNWVVKPGKFKTSKKKEIVDGNQKIKLVDHSWIEESSILKSKTKAYLTKLLNRVPNDEHYYVSIRTGTGNPAFNNEISYRPMDFNDDGLRLLSLFRYWNIIEYYFPYKRLMDEKWDNVLKDFIPKYVNATDGFSYKLTTLELIGKIQDTHANIWMRDEDLASFHGIFGPPIQIKWIENHWVVTRIFDTFENPYSKIQTGDIVTHVNGKIIAGLIPLKAKYCPASNVAVQMRDVAKRLLRTNETKIKLTFKNSNETYNEEINTILNEGIRYWEHDNPSHKFLEDDIGYIYPAALKEDEIHDIMKTFAKTKSIIIDMRCYPSDFLVMKLGIYLLPEITKFAKFTKLVFDKPGHYAFTPEMVNGSQNPNYYKGKVFILINEETQSQAEYTTMALRNAPQATIIGSNTAGADGDVSRVLLPGGIRTAFSGIGVYYPDGRETQRIGIVPDIECKPTIEGIRKGKDELLELAIEMSKEK